MVKQIPIFSTDVEGVNNRIEFIDTVRALSVYWIVCFSHLSSYMEESFRSLKTPEMHDITRYSLAVMMFISGYLLSKYKFNSKSDVLSFYIRRFYRFYCLFLLSAVLLFYLKFIPDFKIVLTSICGLSSYILPQPSTLWFMSMLMSFYLITPILRKLFANYSSYKNLVILFILYAIIIWLETILDIDNRLHWCFCAYLIGLIFGWSDLLFLLLQKKMLGIGFVILDIILIIYRSTGANVFDIDIFSGLIGLLFISKWLTSIHLRKFFLFCSYTSMALYLFHRHFYIIERITYRHFVDAVVPLPTWYGLLIMIPATIIGSYYIQRTYDIILSYIKD